MGKEEIQKLVTASFETRPSFFLVDLQVSSDNRINIVLDGDQPVSIDDCIEISREIEGELDLTGLDFSLEVSSAGISSPLKFPRQYKKNIGRKLKVRTGGNQIEAELVNATDEYVELSWSQREPKPVGKGKHTVQKTAVIEYKDIEEAKVMITFN